MDAESNSGPPTAVEGLRFDVFMSYNRQDEREVMIVAERLKQQRVVPWIDRWCIGPGDAWQSKILDGLARADSYALFIGSSGLGDWAREELAVAQTRAAKDRGFRLFMVLLPGAPQLHDPSLAFLSTRTWVDLRDGVASDAGDHDLIRASGGSRRAWRPLRSGRRMPLPWPRGLPGGARRPVLRARGGHRARRREAQGGTLPGGARPVRQRQELARPCRRRAGTAPRRARGQRVVEHLRLRARSAAARRRWPRRSRACRAAESMAGTLDAMRGDERTLDLA